jgi:D-aminopeptidase
VRRTPARRASITPAPDVGNDNISPLFVAVADATEEAIANSLLMAETMTSRDPATGQMRSVPAVDGALVKLLISRR